MVPLESVMALESVVPVESVQARGTAAVECPGELELFNVAPSFTFPAVASS